MTRKDYALIAQAVKSARERFATSSYPDRVETLNFAAIIIASELSKALESQSKFDKNGNRLFDTQRFLAACKS